MSDIIESVVVYEQPSCGMCTAVKRALQRMGITPVIKQIADHPDIRDQMVAQGWTAAPLVMVNYLGGTPSWGWGGMRTAELDQVKRELEAHGHA